MHMSSSVSRSRIRVAFGRDSLPQEHLMTFSAQPCEQQEVKKMDSDVGVTASYTVKPTSGVEQNALVCTCFFFTIRYSQLHTGKTNDSPFRVR